MGDEQLPESVEMAIESALRAAMLADVPVEPEEANLRAAIRAYARDAVRRALTEARMAVRGCDLVDFGTCREFDAVSQQRDRCTTAVEAIRDRETKPEGGRPA